VALTLIQARNKVRQKTRHVNDTTRVTDTLLNSILNEKYKELRTELQEIAPSFGLCTKEVTLTATGNQIGLTDVDPPFERMYKLEKLDRCGDYREVKRADAVQPYRHAGACVAWEKRGSCIWLHPEGKVSGTFRVFYYGTPNDLTDDASLFAIPVPLESVLIYRACAEVNITRGDDPGAFEKKAEQRLEAVRDIVWLEYGIQDEQAGFEEVLPF
jgi:hypothetical protein